MNKKTIEQFEIKENWIYEQTGDWCLGIKNIVNGKYVIEVKGKEDISKYREQNKYNSNCYVIKKVYADIIGGGIYRYLPRGLSWLYYKHKM